MERVVVDAIERATLDVFSLMVGVEVTKEPNAVMANDRRTECTDVVSSFTLTGAISGTASVSYSLQLAHFITNQMLQSTESQENEVLDAAGEVANMIVGNVKNDLEDHLGHIEIGVPAIAIVTRTQKLPDSVGLSAVTFRCSGSVFSVGISFQNAVTGGNPCWNEGRSVVSSGCPSLQG